MKKKDIIASYNSMGLADGYCERYSGNRLMFKGNYINGKKVGYWEFYRIKDLSYKRIVYYII